MTGSSHGHRLKGAYLVTLAPGVDEFCGLGERVLLEDLDRLTQVGLVDVQGDVRRCDLHGSGDSAPAQNEVAHLEPEPWEA